MKAIVITRGGAPDALQIREIEPPTLTPSHAWVTLRAAGLNHRDVWQRVGYPGPEPMILGSDGAGTVEAVGADDDRAWLVPVVTCAVLPVNCHVWRNFVEVGSAHDGGRAEPLRQH